MPVHFKGPILGAAHDGDRQFFQDLPLVVDLDHHIFFDDFNQLAINSTNDWTVVKDASATVALGADAASGTVVLTSQATTDDDGASIQTQELFLPAVGKKIWFETRIQGSTVADMDIFVGLSENFATNPEAVLTASNYIGFRVTDGSAVIAAQCEAADTQTTQSTGVSAVDATYITLGFVVNGTSKIDYFVNRAYVCSNTTNIPTTELAVALFELSGSITGTRSMTVDYVFAAASRNAVEAWS
jgi:predicted nucleic acid-binding protein